LEAPVTQLLRCLAFIKIVTLVGEILTAAYIVVIVAWQLTTFAEGKPLPAFTVSYALDLLNLDHGHNYLAQATRGIRSVDVSALMDSLSNLPAVVPLIIAAILLVIYYACVGHLEKQYAHNS
jgi:hypothetical protein